MKKYDSLIFDLDGTLWNASRASAIGWTKGLKKLGVHDHTVKKEDIESVAGTPFKGCVEILLPHIDIPLEELLETLNDYEIQAVKDEGGEIYHEVDKYIPKLSKRYALYIVSNCQEWYLNCFYEQFKLGEFFSDWDCHGRLKRSKADNIKDVISRNNLKKSVYIGDTKSDQDAARKAGVDFIHCEYGFGDIEVDHSYKSFSDLAKSFLQD